MAKRIVLLAAFLLASVLAAGAQSVSSSQIIASIGLDLAIAGTFQSTTYIDVVNSSGARLGDVAVSSNTKAAWKITISSAGGGKLRGDTPGNTDTYPYLLNFDTVRGINLSQDFVYFTGVTSRDVSYPITVSFTPYAELDFLPAADTYRDVITITVSLV